MRHSTFAILLGSLLPLCSVGQVTIGQNDMPHANDALVRSRAFISPGINYAATGAGYQWDFSNLTVNTTDTAEYLTVASTNFIHAITFADLVFNANRANHAKRGVDIPFSQLLPISDPYTFYYRNATQYRSVGFGVELSGIPVPIVFTDHDVIYELPLEYGDVSSDQSSWNISIPGIGYYGNNQLRENEVDGWGAITTPAGSFDVLRVRTTLQVSDTLSLGFSIDRPTIREYKWLTPGLRIPVLQINTTEVFGFEVVSAIYYYDVPRSIEVVQPLAATLCPGATVNVPYDAAGVYNVGGFFILPNHFTAQLSDANGSFSSPVIIGDTIATASGSITATIPANTPLGTGYRIRVISTSPAYIGSDNGFDISIGGNATASVSAGGSTMLCAGDSVLLTAVGGPSYQWFQDGQPITGAVSENLYATTTAAYTVSVNNLCGSATSTAISVQVHLPPVHLLDTLSVSTCAGDPVQFIAHDATGQTPLTYQWYLNNAPIPGALDTIMDPSLPGAYTMSTTNTMTGCVHVTDTLVFSIETVDAPLVSVIGDTVFCDGGSVVLETTAIPGHSYQWYADQVALPGADTSLLLVTLPGNYTLIATSTNSCASDPSTGIEVQVDTLPDPPMIYAGGQLMFCEGGSVVLSTDTVQGADYQWSINGNDITGATAQLLVADSTGSYGVLVTGANGCSAASMTAVSVVEHADPPAPVITQSFDSLLASGTGSFQWYLDGVLLPGATDAFHLPLANGTYTVTVTDGNGCSNISLGSLWLSTGILTGEQVRCALYPNPNSGTFTLTLEGNVALGMHYRIIDVSGRIVQQGRITDAVSLITMNSGPGVYSVVLSSSSSMAVQRLVVE